MNNNSMGDVAILRDRHILSVYGSRKIIIIKLNTLKEHPSFAKIWSQKYWGNGGYIKLACKYQSQ